MPEFPSLSPAQRRSAHLGVRIPQGYSKSELTVEITIHPGKTDRDVDICRLTQNVVEQLNGRLGVVSDQDAYYMSHAGHTHWRQCYHGEEGVQSWTAETLLFKTELGTVARVLPQTLAECFPDEFSNYRLEETSLSLAKLFPELLSDSMWPKEESLTLSDIFSDLLKGECGKPAAESMTLSQMFSDVLAECESDLTSCPSLGSLFWAQLSGQHEPERLALSDLYEWIVGSQYKRQNPKRYAA